MRLRELLRDIPHLLQQGTVDIPIQQVGADSRKVTPGDVFVAYQGVNVDGHTFLRQAIQRGAKALVLERRPSFSIDESVTLILVSDGREALAHMASNLYGRPAEQLRMVGITGTNGKTSTAYFTYAILKQSGLNPGLLGTVRYGYGDTWVPPATTTPDALQLQAMLAQMREHKVDSVVMEVTSHALSQRRVEGIPFEVAIFTNLTQDHLDFHADMQEYLDAKLRLFHLLHPGGGIAILNADDPASATIEKEVQRQPGCHCLYYSLREQADFWAEDVRMDREGMRFRVRSVTGSYPVQLPMLGEYNVSNALAAIAVATLWGCDPASIQEALAHTRVPGRFERVECGQDFTVVVDYAHTPDALERVLKEARKATQGRLLCVFGCGGDRDRAKRPKMGKIASELADLVVITSDNPRTEDPESIIQEILAGMDGHRNWIAIPDRAEAIRRAIEGAKRGDMVVIAGKGHEDYQILGDRRIHFDDREVARGFLNTWEGRSDSD